MPLVLNPPSPCTPGVPNRTSPFRRLTQRDVIASSSRLCCRQPGGPDAMASSTCCSRDETPWRSRCHAYDQYPIILVFCICSALACNFCQSPTGEAQKAERCSKVWTRGGAWGKKQQVMVLEGDLTFSLTANPIHGCLLTENLHESLRKRFASLCRARAERLPDGPGRAAPELNLREASQDTDSSTRAKGK
jgi:hypothetical protein